ncbi:hypothetical protein HDU99_010782 [Rhizoclosmatium hyalinum]|nr:hypothetical protein HDU99_010782 [Rhizoclosmatium hyalinum]
MPSSHKLQLLRNLDIESRLFRHFLLTDYPYSVYVERERLQNIQDIADTKITQVRGRVEMLISMMPNEVLDMSVDEFVTKYGGSTAAVKAALLGKKRQGGEPGTVKQKKLRTDNMQKFVPPSVLKKLNASHPSNIIPSTAAYSREQNGDEDEDADTSMFQNSIILSHTPYLPTTTTSTLFPLTNPSSSTEKSPEKSGKADFRARMGYLDSLLNAVKK